MELEKRLRSQWTKYAQDWIETDQAVRKGMLDSWMLDALGDVSGKSVIDIGCGEGRFCRQILPTFPISTLGLAGNSTRCSRIAERSGYHEC